MKLNHKGLLLVISGPSGVGKSSVRKELFSAKDHNLAYSISMTTRPPREGEVEGSDYYFVDHNTFQEKIKEGAFLEWAKFVGNYYGTLKSEIQKLRDQGKEVILEIEVEGALQVRNEVKDGIFIFLVPPTKEQLYNRLKNRGTEDRLTIQERIRKAESEYNLAYKYDYIVVNDTVENAADRIRAIIRAEHAKTERSIHKYYSLLEAIKNEKLEIEKNKGE